MAFGLQEHEQHRVGRQYGHNSESVRVLQHSGRHWRSPSGDAKLVGRGDDAWHVRRDVFGGQIGDGLAVDQQPISAEHDRGVDAVALADRGYEIADSGHVAPMGKWLRR